MRNDVEFRGFKDYLKSIFKSRATYVGLLVAGIVGVLIWRLYNLQIVNGEEYKQKAAETVLTTAELTVKAEIFTTATACCLPRRALHIKLIW